MQSNRKLIVLAAAFAAVYIFWGSTYLAIKYAIETMPPFIMAGSRFLIAGGILFGLAIVSKDFELPTWRHWRTSLIIGTLLLLGGNGGVVFAEKHISSSLAALLVASEPFWIVILSWLWLKNGRPAYISTRLRVLQAGTITDVELSADTSSRVVAAYVYALDPRYTEVLPPEQRMSRDSLEALGRRYFMGLTDHRPVAEDYDDHCDRYHSGQRVTNATSNSVEGGPPRTCFGSNNGDRPWGPAIEQRFPIVDPERGIVFGLTLLLYPKSPNQQRMYVSEIFKVVNHKVVQIDNIGLMMPGVPTNGFVH